jgi:hypothetical protein
MQEQEQKLQKQEATIMRQQKDFESKFARQQKKIELEFSRLPLYAITV